MASAIKLYFSSHRSSIIKAYNLLGIAPLLSLEKEYLTCHSIRFIDLFSYATWLQYISLDPQIPGFLHWRFNARSSHSRH